MVMMVMVRFSVVGSNEQFSREGATAIALDRLPISQSFDIFQFQETLVGGDERQVQG
jgi:hypothetical protein